MSEKIEIPVEKQEYGGSVKVHVLPGVALKGIKISEPYFREKLANPDFKQEANAKIDEYFSPN